MAMSAADFFAGVPSAKDEREFWKSIRLPNRTFKTTSDDRMKDLNIAVSGYWKSIGFMPARICDVGASSGITSAEWLASLRNDGWSPEFIATDMMLNAKLLQPLSFYSALVLERQPDWPLQHILFRSAVIPRLRRGGRSLVKSIFSDALYKALRFLGSPMNERARVLLVSPRARQVEGLRFAEDDIFDATNKGALGKFNVVRVANLLNHEYFPEDKLSRGVANIKAMLHGPNSFLIVNRTLEDGTNHGTMFRLNAAMKFESCITIGRGSEITDLVSIA